MCGISGVYLTSRDEGAAYILHESLVILQHRGQDAAGIATANDSGAVNIEKDRGLVRDVFNQVNISKLEGNYGIAHVRYPTSGSKCKQEAQPFYTNYPYGISIVHNGNITNCKKLHELVTNKWHRHTSTVSDSELILNVFAESLSKIIDSTTVLTDKIIFKALETVYSNCKGGYSCLLLIPKFGIVGFRDPNGIRPLVCGRRDSSVETDSSKVLSDYMFASETAALNIFNFNDYSNIKPGEAAVVTKDGLSKHVVAPGGKFAPDIFEYIYFARADSVIDGVSVYKARVAMGDALASKVASRLNVSEIDCVIPVPDTGRLSALQLSTNLGIPYREGFIKNRYIGRTFIMASPAERILNIRRKITPIREEFFGKVVLLVDDSIVRGTTSKEIITMARLAGAKKVYIASCSPPIRYPNFYGIDTPTRTELIATDKTDVQIAAEIGADGVIFQDIDKLTKSITSLNKDLSFFDLSVFTGNYVTGDIDEEYIMDLEKHKGCNGSSHLQVSILGEQGHTAKTYPSNSVPKHFTPVTKFKA